MIGAPNLAEAGRIRRAPMTGLLRRVGGLDSAGTLIEAAQRRTGLSWQVDAEAQAGLAALVASLRAEAGLSAFGTLATRHDLVGKISNLLTMADREAADPSILERGIEAPVFITGLPRSGTTFLQAVMAEHPGLSAPRAWQTMFPVPDHPSAGWGSAGWGSPRARFARQLAVFHRLAPELASLHPITADAPQECTEMSAHVFRSLRFDSTHRVPSYRAWLDRAGHEAAYAFNRRFLQHLQGTGATRWVLKSPDHVFALGALRRAFPDARLVLVHRDPLRVIASVARLTELLRRPFARRPDRREIGRQVLRDWRDGMERIMAVEDGDAVHVRHDALIGDPIGTVSALCERLGVAVDEGARAAMAAYVERRPRGGYGRNRYALEAFGIDASELEPWRGRYLGRFGA